MRYRIEFEVDIEDKDATGAEITEYLEYSFGERNDMSGSNPYCMERAPDPVLGSFQIDRA